MANWGITTFHFPSAVVQLPLVPMWKGLCAHWLASSGTQNTSRYSLQCYGFRRHEGSDCTICWLIFSQSELWLCTATALFVFWEEVNQLKTQELKVARRECARCLSAGYVAPSLISFQSTFAGHSQLCPISAAVINQIDDLQFPHKWGEGDTAVSQQKPVPEAPSGHQGPSRKQILSLKAKS